jgi:hypothetical protein
MFDKLGRSSEAQHGIAAALSFDPKLSFLEGPKAQEKLLRHARKNSLASAR